jgi:hypothetical protein
MHSVFTSRRNLSLVAQTALAIAASMSLSTLSHAQGDSGYTQYRCVVLNESQACPAPSPAPATQVKTEIVAGPYASYLMHLGQDSETAIATARARGEIATLRTVQISMRQLSAIELYERHLGHLSPSATTYKTLAEAPLEAPIAQSRAESPRKGSL